MWDKIAFEHDKDSSAKNVGLLYFKGEGVEKDIEQAERLFILAHKRGDKNSFSNLVNLYLFTNEPDKALEWHERALQSNSLFDIRRDEEVRKIIAFKKMGNFESLLILNHNENTNIL